MPVPAIEPCRFTYQVPNRWNGLGVIIYGCATVTPEDDVVAGCLGTWRVTIVVGCHGIDDGGRVLVARRPISDWGIPQLYKLRDLEYVTVSTSGLARLSADEPSFDNNR